jgi:translin
VIYSSLESVEEKRESVIKGTRDINLLCSKSIVAIHDNRIDEANSNIQKARSLLSSYKNNATPELLKYFHTPEQELVEANCLLSIVFNRSLPSPMDLDVTGASYVMGLLDGIGEIKRMIYDKMRNNFVDDALNLFNLAQGLYNQLYPFAVFDNLVPGLRRKLDVNKILLEDVRSLITEESRRKEMINRMSRIVDDTT